MLAIGFASISTTLVINGTIGIISKKDDFNVIFTNAELDGKIRQDFIEPETKQTITFVTKELSALNESTTLEYEVTNTSRIYDADVTISCTPVENEYVDLTYIPATNKMIVEAGKTEIGSITARLKKVSYDAKEIKVSCTLNVNGKERTKLGDEYIPSHIITFDAAGGSLEQTIKKVPYGETYGELPVPEKEGYGFVGWYDENDNQIEDTSEIDGNKTLHAKWILIETGTEWTFDFTGGEQEFEVPCYGEYMLETWGAQGGSYNSTYRGGYGGYSIGSIELHNKDKLFINVGGQGIHVGGINSGAVVITAEVLLFILGVMETNDAQLEEEQHILPYLLENFQH